MTEFDFDETGPPDGIVGYYFDVRAVGYVPTLAYHWHSTIGTLSRQALMLREGRLSTLVGVAGFTAEPDRGTIFVSIADCAGSFSTIDPEASGVSFVLEPSDVDGPIYARNTTPDKTLRAGWLAYFFNVPVTGGLVNVTAQREGRRVAGGQVRVERGAVTFVAFNAPAVWQ